MVFYSKFLSALVDSDKLDYLHVHQIFKLERLSLINNSYLHACAYKHYYTQGDCEKIMSVILFYARYIDLLIWARGFRHELLINASR